eukprot:1283084-Amphidinium_carterae.1
MLPRLASLFSHLLNFPQAETGILDEAVAIFLPGRSNATSLDEHRTIYLIPVLVELYMSALTHTDKAAGSCASSHTSSVTSCLLARRNAYALGTPLKYGVPVSSTHPALGVVF